MPKSTLVCQKKSFDQKDIFIYSLFSTNSFRAFKNQYFNTKLATKILNYGI